MNPEALLTARNLRVVHVRRDGTRRVAVDGVDLHLARGETLGLLGESGCGKTTLARALLGLIAPTAGVVRFDGEDITKLSPAARRTFRRRAQLIFQDAATALNPRMRVCDLVADPLRVHRIARGPALHERVRSALDQVGLTADLADRLPQELSGGQRQRVALARALVLDPHLVICDEPVSALDVSARVRLLDLLARLRTAHQRSYLLITHDPAVARRLCERIAVMHQGRIVEVGPAADVLRAPRHPQTQRLCASAPRLVLAAPPSPSP